MSQRIGKWLHPNKAVKVHFYPNGKNACVCNRYKERPQPFLPGTGRTVEPPVIHPSSFCRLCLRAMEKRYMVPITEVQS